MSFEVPEERNQDPVEPVSEADIHKQARYMIDVAISQTNPNWLDRQRRIDGLITDLGDVLCVRRGEPIPPFSEVTDQVLGTYIAYDEGDLENLISLLKEQQVKWRTEELEGKSPEER